MARRFGFASRISFEMFHGSGMTGIYSETLRTEETMDELAAELKDAPAFITVRSNGPKLVNVSRIAVIEPDPMGVVDISDDATDDSVEVRIARLRWAVERMRGQGKNRMDIREDRIELPYLGEDGMTYARSMNPFKLACGENDKVLREAGILGMDGRRLDDGQWDDGFAYHYRPVRGCASTFHPGATLSGDWTRDDRVGRNGSQPVRYWF